MGEIDLTFKPSVPIFDANVALGRRHDKRVVIDTTEGLINAMDNSGVERALVYSPHAAYFDTLEGNQLILELIKEQSRLIPQFVGNPATENLPDFASKVSKYNIRSIRILPIPHAYPFADWIVGSWLEWMQSIHLPLWIDVEHVEPTQLYKIAKTHPELTIVLIEVHYTHVPWVIPLLRSLPNLSIELSRFVINDGVSRLMDLVGEKRILFGSRFPESSMGQQIYNLHHNNLSISQLTDICSRNLDRILRLKES